jgi:hypothetical protein
MGDELAIIMDDGVQIFFVSGFKGFFIFGKNAHVCVLNADVDKPYRRFRWPLKFIGTFESLRANIDP